MKVFRLTYCMFKTTLHSIPRANSVQLDSGWLIFSLTLLFWSTNYSLTSVLITVVCVAVVEHAWSGASKRASECSDHSTQKLHAKFTEITDGLAYIRGFGWEKHMLRQLFGVARDSEAALHITLSLEPWFEMSMALCWTVMATTLVGYTFCHVDQISPNMLGLGLLALFGLPQMAKDVLAMSMEVKELIAGTDRIRRFMIAADAPSEQGMDPTAESKDRGTIPEIVFENAEIGANP